MMIFCEPVISIRDKGRLMAAIHRARHATPDDLAAIESFRESLRLAQVVAPQDVPGDTITMNSCLEVQDQRSGEVRRHTLIYPDGPPREDGQVSVLSPAGMCYFGARVGDVVRWADAHGRTRAEKIVRLVYQPEAAGHRHL